MQSATLILLLATAPLADAEPRTVDYQTQIKPIFASRCVACHGALKQEGGLRLDTGAGARAGGDSGPAVIPGNPAESDLIQRVSAADPSDRMPPEGEPLTPEQIELLTDWVEQNAVSPSDEQPEADPREHWAFRTPVRPEVPRTAGANENRNPIDQFIIAEQQRRGLVPLPAASPDTVLRRVFLDLVGLPPTREELHAFLQNPTPEAYEAIVNELLSRPQYGERWARHWMDVWRYSDWYGRRHVPDVWNSAPQVWRWRDWIVRSLNHDKGYDQMVREMLAADEIAPDDYEAGVATDYLVRNWFALNPNQWMRDNVEHTGKAFLGLTLNCAHCHDHKYDPITQEEYFGFRAFFEPIGIRQDRVPGEPEPGPFVEYEYSVLRKIERLGSVRIFDKHPEAKTWFYTGGDERNRLEDRGSIAPAVPALLAGAGIEIRPVELPPTASYPGLRPEIQQMELAAAEEAVRQAEAAHAAALAAAQEHAVAGPADHTVASGDTAPADTHGMSLQELSLKSAELQVVSARAGEASVRARIAADCARYAVPPADDAESLARAASVAERTAKVAAAHAALHAAQLARAQAEQLPAENAERNAKLDAAVKAVTDAEATLAAARAALDDPEQAATYTPLSPIYPAQSTGRRRALAEWITRRDNPLTARVAVNHVWLRHFHAPLVETVDNFGRNGSPPTHPELLDWLAVELVDSGWSLKHLHRLIVTSAAYQRLSSLPAGASASSPVALNLEIDANNQFLWRMNAGRMEAEVVRDSLLFVARRLDMTLGGQELENSEALTTHRRSLYYSCYPEAGGSSELGRLFDAPNPMECYRRTRTVIPQQALVLTNSDLVHRLSADAAKRLFAEAADGDEPQTTFVRDAFADVLSRAPTDAELLRCLEFLQRQQAQLEQDGAHEPASAARASLVRALFNHNDFVTIR